MASVAPVGWQRPATHDAFAAHSDVATHIVARGTQPVPRTAPTSKSEGLTPRG